MDSSHFNTIISELTNAPAHFCCKGVKPRSTTTECKGTKKYKWFRGRGSQSREYRQACTRECPRGSRKTSRKQQERSRGIWSYVISLIRGFLAQSFRAPNFLDTLEHNPRRQNDQKRT